MRVDRARIDEAKRPVARAPVLDPLPFLERRRGYSGAESLFLPLSNDGITVNMILVFFDPEAVVKLPGSPSV